MVGEGGGHGRGAAQDRHVRRHRPAGADAPREAADRHHRRGARTGRGAGAVRPRHRAPGAAVRLLRAAPGGAGHPTHAPTAAHGVRVRRRRPGPLPQVLPGGRRRGRGPRDGRALAASGRPAAHPAPGRALTARGALPRPVAPAGGRGAMSDYNAGVFWVWRDSGEEWPATGLPDGFEPWYAEDARQAAEFAGARNNWDAVIVAEINDDGIPVRWWQGEVELQPRADLTCLNVDDIRERSP